MFSYGSKDEVKVGYYLQTRRLLLQLIKMTDCDTLLTKIGSMTEWVNIIWHGSRDMKV